MTTMHDRCIQTICDEVARLKKKACRMCRVTLVEVTIRNVLPVEMTIAAPAASRSEPMTTGNCSKPMRNMISALCTIKAGALHRILPRPSSGT